MAAFKTIVLSTNECLYSKIQIDFKKKQLQPEVLQLSSLKLPVQLNQGGGVLGISSDRDNQRIFLGLKFLIPAFSWVGKFGMDFFGFLYFNK